MAGYLGRLAGRRREDALDRHLAFLLTFVAGAANAGGLMAVGRYTSHMTGIVSRMADDAALGLWAPLAAGAAALGAFVAGAGVSAILINWARRRDMQAEYALPLAVEAGLLTLFACADLLARVHPQTALAGATLLLCFVMGLQNAIITKLSGARIRTTHITGLVTDLGIEAGKALYPNRRGDLVPVRADAPKLRLLAGLAATFFVSGVIGALAFHRAGTAAALPLAALLMTIGAGPLREDLRRAGV